MIRKLILTLAILAAAAAPAQAWSRGPGGGGHFGGAGHFDHFGGHERFEHHGGRGPRVFVGPPLFIEPDPFWYPDPDYPPPAPPTQVYVQPPATQSYWYYCASPEGYYPYVTQCPGGWTQVAPQTSPSSP